MSVRIEKLKLGSEKDNKAVGDAIQKAIDDIDVNWRISVVTGANTIWEAKIDGPNAFKWRKKFDCSDSPKTIAQEIREELLRHCATRK
jgi:hypothetical protein